MYSTPLSTCLRWPLTIVINHHLISHIWPSLTVKLTMTINLNQKLNPLEWFWINLNPPIKIESIWINQSKLNQFESANQHWIESTMINHDWPSLDVVNADQAHGIHRRRRAVAWKRQGPSCVQTGDSLTTNGLPVVNCFEVYLLAGCGYSWYVLVLLVTTCNY